MDDLNDKLGSILNNPQLMQQIASMAQSLGNPQQPQAPSGDPSKQDHLFPDIDMAMVQKLTGLASQGNIDKREQALLHALGAYLSHDRICKLEKAMRAAKMAKIVSGFIGTRRLAGSLGR